MMPTSFTDDATMAQITARALLDIGAVHFDTQALFTHSSGKQAPTYIDCRKIISHPRFRSVTMDFLCAKVARDAGLEAFTSIAGGETAGIPFAAFVAERLGLPMCYVRKQPKGYGRTAQIEGEITEGDRVLLVEDLTTDGGSKLKFAEALRKAGAHCAHTAVVFYYGVMPGVEAQLAAQGLTLHYLATWADVIAAARSGGYFDETTLADVEQFLSDPEEWRRARGLDV